MTTEEMDRQLKRAFGYLLGLTKGDVDLASEALPWVWWHLSTKGAIISRTLLKRCLWSARRKPFPGTSTGTGCRDDAARRPRGQFTYWQMSTADPSPSRLASAHEALDLVLDEARTDLECEIAIGKLDGETLDTLADRVGRNPATVQSTWWKYRKRCRTKYRSLLGAF